MAKQQTNKGSCQSARYITAVMPEAAVCTVRNKHRAVVCPQNSTPIRFTIPLMGSGQKKGNLLCFTLKFESHVNMRTTAPK